MPNIKEELLNHLKMQGLMPTIDDDGDIYFKYQMVSFYILCDDSDEFFLRMAVPNLFSVDENNRIDVLEVCNTVSRRMKVAKAYITPNNNVWIVAEELLDQNPNYEDVIPRTIQILMDSRGVFIEEINK